MVSLETNADRFKVYSDGHVVWEPGGLYRLRCESDNLKQPSSNTDYMSCHLSMFVI